MASEICFDRIEYRLTCPTYPFMLLTLISFIHINYRGLKYQLHKIGCYLAVILILIILVHIQITNSVEFYQFAKDGQGYNSPDWKYEDDIRWLRDLPSNNVTIFTNRQDAIQFILKRPSYGLTRNINLNDEDDTYIIYFKDRYTLGWYENIIDMDRDTLTVVFDSSRTIIYKTDSGDKSQLRDICKPILDAGYTTQGLTKWVQYGSNGIFVDVNTSSAGFTETPIYITSLGGYYHHWRTTGTTSIYNATPTGFRVYVFYEDGPVTPAQANSWGWHIQWVGIPRNKVNASSTTPGATDWVKYGNKELYVDVNTSSAGFNETPIYITSLGGYYHHWRTTGTTSIYNATPTGFRVYVFYEDGPVTPAQANSWGWHIQWVGIPRNKVNASSTTPGETDWVKYGNKGLYVDVNTSSAGFNETPIYVTSLGGSSKHWRAIGTTSIYSATPTGFRVHVFYEDGAVTPTQANSCKWHIQWIGI